MRWIGENALYQYEDGKLLYEKKGDIELHYGYDTNGQPRYVHYVKDNGIYDAMNKGIAKASGDWINILNSGDHYASTTSLEDAVRNTDTDKVDVIFGDSIEIHKHFLYNKYADNDLSKLEYVPTFRHGSALIKASVHKANKFDLSKKKQLNYLR